MPRLPLTAIALTLALFHSGRAIADDSAEVKKLIPAAAGMSLADFDKLATASKIPKPSDFEDQSLTLVLLSLSPKDSEEAQTQFRYVGEVPKPAVLAKEITRLVRGRKRFRVALGPVTMIHADRITEFTCQVEGDSAAGIVAFKVPDLYEGKVRYRAERKNDEWKIVEFAMPAYDLHIERQAGGNWTKQ